MTEHKHAALLRMAADNADQRFTCDGFEHTYDIRGVIECPHNNWRPVAKPKKTIKRWLWSDELGEITQELFSDDEIKEWDYSIKLLWSETEFEVEHE